METYIKFNVDNAEAIRRLDMGSDATIKYGKEIEALSKKAEKATIGQVEHAEEVKRIEGVYDSITSNLHALTLATAEQAAAYEDSSKQFKEGVITSDEFKAQTEQLTGEMLKNATATDEMDKASTNLLETMRLSEKATAAYTAEAEELTKYRDDEKISVAEYAQELKKAETVRDVFLKNAGALTTANGEQAKSFKTLIENYRAGKISSDELTERTSYLAAQMGKTGDSVEKLAEKTTKTRVSFNDFSKGLVQGVKDLASGNIGISEFAGSMGKMLVSMNPLTIGLTAVGAVIAGNAKAAWESAKAMDEYINRMNVFTGDSAKSAAVMNEVNGSLTASAFGFKVAQEAAIDFIAAGIATEDVVAQMNAIGNLAQGDAEKFKALTKQYTGWINEGKVEYKDLKRIQEEGIPVLDELAEMYGVNRHEMEKMINDGKIGLAEVDQAFEKIINTNENFTDSLATANANFAGSMGELKDVWNVIIGNVALVFLPVIQQIVSSVTQWLRKIEEVSTKFGDLGDEFKTLTESSPFLALKYMFEVVISNAVDVIGNVITKVVELGKKIVGMYLNVTEATGAFNALTRTFELIWDVGRISLNALFDFIATGINTQLELFKGWGEIIAGVFTLDWERIKRGAAQGKDAFLGHYRGIADVAVEAAKEVQMAWEKAIMPDDFRSSFNKYKRQQTMDMEQTLQVFRDNEAISEQAHADLLKAIATKKTDKMIAELERLKEAGEIQLTEYEEILGRINAMKSSNTSFTGSDVTDKVDPPVTPGKELTEAEKKLNELRERVKKALGELYAEGKISLEEHEGMIEKIATLNKDGMLKMFKGLYESKDLGRQEYIKVLEAMGEDTKHLQDDWKGFAQAMVKFTASSLAEIARISSGFKKLEIEELDRQLKEEKRLREQAQNDEADALKQRYEDGLINEAEFLAQESELKKMNAEENERLDKEAKDRLNELKKKEFESNKALTLAQIPLNLASTIMGILASSTQLGLAGPIFAGIQIGMATGLAGAQTALVAKQTFVPAARKGGMVSDGGIVSVGEQGQEFIDMPAGARVTPLSSMPPFEASEKGRDVVINIITNGVNLAQDSIDGLVDTVDERIGQRVRNGEL